MYRIVDNSLSQGQGHKTKNSNINLTKRGSDTFITVAKIIARRYLNKLRRFIILECIRQDA
jgi:hypothetical protein